MLGLPGAIAVQREPGGLVLCLAGEVDGAVVEAFPRGGGRTPIPVTAIDAGAVTFIGSAGVALLLRWAHASVDDGRRRCCAGRPGVSTVDCNCWASSTTSDEANLERLLLIVEELASNGLRHGRPPVRVVVTADPTGWLLDVSDAAADRPPTFARDRDPGAGGLGLPLVAGHGWAMHGERKHVWARIDATAVPGPSNGAVPSPRRDTPPADGGRPGAEDSSARIRGVIDDRAAELGFLPVLRITGPLPELTNDIVTDLLAVLREALTNVARHARARSAHVALAVTGDAVTLRVRDDGIGLADLRRRAAWHGGTLSVQLDPDGGDPADLGGAPVGEHAAAAPDGLTAGTVSTGAPPERCGRRRRRCC